MFSIRIITTSIVPHKIVLFECHYKLATIYCLNFGLKLALIHLHCTASFVHKNNCYSQHALANSFLFCLAKSSNFLVCVLLVDSWNFVGMGRSCDDGDAIWSLGSVCCLTGQTGKGRSLGHQVR